MLNFRLVEKEDIKILREFYDHTESIGMECNPLNAYLWREKFNIYITVKNGTLFKAYLTDDGKIWGYSMPVGGDLRMAVEEIFADAKERKSTPTIALLTKAERATLETLYPSKFVYTRSPENQDYIYLSEDLINLSGKKFHAKRNHISRFFKTYDNVRFALIDKTNKVDAYNVAVDWCKENNVDFENYYEMDIIRDALENMEEYHMRGAVLYVDEKPVAMTMGSEISKIAFDVNFEKALRSYDGVYAVINNEFAKTLSAYKYINREEDMGIEGLKKAKLSYNPIIILDRYNAQPK